MNFSYTQAWYDFTILMKKISVNRELNEICAPPTHPPLKKKNINRSIRIIGRDQRFWKKKYRPITRKLRYQITGTVLLLHYKGTSLQLPRKMVERDGVRTDVAA